MPTQNQIARLGIAAQDILDGRVFHEVRTHIEQIAEDAPNDWHGARLCKSPSTAAYDHLIAATAIKNIVTGNVVDAPPDASMSEKYLAMTAGVDEAAGKQVIVGRHELGQTLVEAYKYLELQMARISGFEAANPDYSKRRGKENVTLSVGESLVVQATGNASINSMATVVREAIRICLAEGVVPVAEELTEKIKANLRHHASITRLPGQVFRQIIFGQKLTSEHHKSMQSGSAIELTKWNAVLKELAENDNLLPIVYELVHTLKANLAEELGRIASIETLGFCAAQFALRPNEPIFARQFFGSEGIVMPNDSFTVTEYQLLRGLQAARVTIFADPLYRRSLGQLADILKKSQDSGR